MLYPSVATGLLFTMKKDLLSKKLGNFTETDLNELDKVISSNLDFK